MAQESRKPELIAELVRARHGIAANLRGLQLGLDVGHRLETTYRRHSFAWLGGASLLGFVFAKITRPRRKVIVQPRGRKSAAEGKVVQAGLFVTALKIAFDLTRPVLTKWLTRKVITYAGEKFAPPRQA